MIFFDSISWSKYLLKCENPAAPLEPREKTVDFYLEICKT